MDIQEATPIKLTAEERSALEAMIRSPKTEHVLVERARIVLLAAQGRSTRSIAAELDTWPGRVSRWRTRFARHRLAGLHDLPRPGPAPRYTADTGKRILALLDQPPPSGYGRWTAPLLSRELGDVSDQYIWRFLRAHKINLGRASPGVRATIRTLSPRPPRLSASTSTRRRMPSCWRVSYNTRAI